MTLNRTQQPPVTPFGALHMPQPRITRLNNGIELFIIDKGDQEVCRLDILFEGGRYAGKTPAIADMTGPMLRKGVPGMDAEAIAEHLDYYGAWMQTGTTQHFSALSLFSLNRNLHQVLPVIAAMITEPTMPQKPFDVLQQQRIQQLEINRQKVSYLASEAFNSLIFGSSHPYARITTAQDLEAVTLNDLQQYHHNFYLNTGIHIILSGRITDDVLEQVNRSFGLLTPAPTTIQNTPQPM